MRIQEEKHQGTQVETGANTVKYTNVEVPNSKGALGVAISEILLLGDAAEIPAGANGEATHDIAVLSGKLAPTTAIPNESGYVAGYRDRCTSAGAGVVGARQAIGAPYWQGLEDIPKDSRDNLFYFTLVNKGGGNAAAKNCFYKVKFKVMWP